jgi:hypothetical protein
LLFRTHCFARASAPLMRAARVRAEELGRSDRVAAGICTYLNEHIAEEEVHGDWLLEDLEVLGLPREHVLARIPPATIASGVGAQYYWIQHYHPVALLAYIAVLEQSVLPPWVLESLIARSRSPAGAFRTLREHARLDPEHTARLYALLDELAPSPELVQLLGINAFETVALLDRSLSEIFLPLPAANVSGRSSNSRGRARAGPQRMAAVARRTDDR